MIGKYIYNFSGHQKENLREKREMSDGESSETNKTKETRMATTNTRYIGSLEAFVVGENFDDYLVGVNNYFALNKINEDEKKMRLFINQIGAVASAKIIKAFKPASFSTKSFDENVAMAKKLFGSEKNSIVEHFKFNNRSQKEGETLGDFAVELQALSEHCEFGAFLDTALRDRFVAGIINKHTKKAVLSLDSNKKFTEVVDCAKKEELVYREAVEMSAKVEEKINKVQPNKFRPNNYQRNKVPFHSYGENARSGERGIRCHRCKKVGHIARNCFANITPQGGRQRRPESANRANAIEENFGTMNIEMEDDGEYLQLKDDQLVANISSILGESNKNGAIELIELEVDAKNVKFECDTGSRVSLICLMDYRKYFIDKRIASVNLPLSVLSGQRLNVKGKIKVNVGRKDKRQVFDLFVIDTMQKFIPLLGRDWLDKLCPDWRSAFKINKVETENAMTQFREKCVGDFKKNYEKLFDNDLTEPIRDITVNIRMNENAKPFVHKAYNVPFSIRESVGKEIDKLEKMGILEKIEYCEWASPMVVAKKANGEIRPCLDGSRTINPHIETHHYPIPLIDELLANKGDAKWFCVLDLKGAYTQLKVNEKTKKILAVNTLKGLYAYKRLPFGVKPAASIFQFAMDKILKGLENVQSFIDDLLIWGRDPEELRQIVINVLERLMSFNVKVNWEKCQWFVNKVTYLGHVITPEGIKPNTEKIKAILEAPIPKNVSELKSFLGMIMFYSKFLKNLCVKLRPLYELLKKDKEWNWTSECQNSYDLCKRELCEDHILTHYDPRKKIVVTCDASDEGISGILSHIIDGCERPVFFVSRTLTTAERKYPILHREALAMVFAMEKFYKYVYGHFVTIFTDHKPLEGIFNCKKGEPPVIATRLQRYVIRLSIFDYEVKHRKGKNNGNADFLSRLPIVNVQSEADKMEEHNCIINAVITGGELTLDVERIRQETNKDEQLVKLRNCVMFGWNNEGTQRELKHFFEKNEDLHVEFDCVMMGERIIIPQTLRKATLKVLHTNHLGMTRMKQIARKYVYWQGINADIEKFILECESCQILRKDDRKKVFGKWPETTFPWERVHMDFFHFQGSEFLIVIDVYSRWLEIKQMRRTNAESVIKQLESIFRLFGWPVEIVTDNGPPFNSFELTKYLTERGIKFTHSPPYHPESNGIIERAVQTAKSVLRKFINDSKSPSQLTEMIDKFLTNHRNLPTTENLIVPAKRIFAYTPRRELSNLKYNNRVELNKCKISKQKELLNKLGEPSKLIKFENNEKVLYLSKLKGYTYAYPAKVLEKKSPMVYLIKCSDHVKLAHVNQLRRSKLKNFIYNQEANKEIAEKNLVRENCNDKESVPTEVGTRTSTRVRAQTKPFTLNWFFPHYRKDF